MAEVIIVEDAAEGGELAATAILNCVEQIPDAVLGVATGSTPLTAYAALARLKSEREVNFSKVSLFALDEYVGLPTGHPESYAAIVSREVAVPLGVDAARVHLPDGAVGELSTAGVRYEHDIREAGGVDIQILGLGTTGHIGFNEPGSSLSSLTRVKTLAEQTRIDNARFFDSLEQVPMHCVTQGIGTILRSRHLLLLAFGAGKAAALAAAVEGPVTSSLPGSAIQLHAHVTVIADEAAASQLTRRDYYDYVYRNKPTWQGI